MNEAIIQGIKTIGVGKKGSQDLSLDQVQGIEKNLLAPATTDAARGAFIGALMIKARAPQEERMLRQIFPSDNHLPEHIMEMIAPQAPEFIKHICCRLMSKEELTRNEAYQVGAFLYADTPGDAARGLIASILRVRYETADEYDGLLRSLTDTFKEEFKEGVPTQEPIIQIAEPFDGVDHSFLITPVIGHLLQQGGYRVVHVVGQSGGPKLVYNLADLAQALNSTFLKQNKDLAAPKPKTGWYLHQTDLSPALPRWTTIRRQIIKRPFLATIERFVNPCQARILVASAFHPPYGEKMLNLAKRAGFAAAIIVRNGLEGTTAFPLMRSAVMLCTVREREHYVDTTFEYDAQKELNITIAREEKFDRPDLQKNKELIEEYLAKGYTEYDLFNHRVTATCAGIRRALGWIKGGTRT